MDTPRTVVPVLAARGAPSSRGLLGAVDQGRSGSGQTWSRCAHVSLGAGETQTGRELRPPPALASDAEAARRHVSLPDPARPPSADGAGGKQEAKVLNLASEGPSKDDDPGGSTPGPNLRNASTGAAENVSAIRAAR
jgi:hypothetical protein